MNYAEIAKEIRLEILRHIHRAQTSHIGSNLGAVDYALTLYENLKPEDRVVWSKGWSAILTYILLFQLIFQKT